MEISNRIKLLIQLSLIALRGIGMAGMASISMQPVLAQSGNELPIADAHVHYSHDSVDQTSPERVIEIMREANLKFALVSSSDDRGTALLVKLAPDLIVPGLRPYSKRGQLSTWFTNPAILDYVDDLLARQRYASIGEFHLYGDDTKLEIPQRIVMLAEEHNLLLHAHSDSQAIEGLLQQSDSIKIIWAHAGFENPENIASMLAKHDRLWADLAFRSEVGSGGDLSQGWRELFLRFPDRLMLGTDTYTPERMHFLPLHAQNARIWLQSLPKDVAENVAWRNAYNLIMPVWHENKSKPLTPGKTLTNSKCSSSLTENEFFLENAELQVRITPETDIKVSQPFSALLTVCSENIPTSDISLDAAMPMHGHGMNYTPQVKLLESTQRMTQFKANGLVLHMPGQWQWRVDVIQNGSRAALFHDFDIQ